MTREEVLNKELERLHKELETKEWSFDRDPIILLIHRTLDMLQELTHKVTLPEEDKNE